jgi:O-antigen biosynthesis protein WbqP
LVEAGRSEKQAIPDAEVPKHDDRNTAACYAFATGSRKPSHTSLDELPQLFVIFRGDMTFVGPRPALFNQDDLLSLRTEFGVNVLVPGLTGWAQINGRDQLSIPEKVQFDRENLLRRSLAFDIAIIGRTVFRALVQQGVHH